VRLAAPLIHRRPEVPLRQSRLDFQRFGPAGAGFLGFAVGFQNAAQVEQRLGHIGLLRQRVPVQADGLVELPRLFVHQAGVIEHLSGTLTQIDQAYVQLQRRIEIGAVTPISSTLTNREARAKRRANPTASATAPSRSNPNSGRWSADRAGGPWCWQRTMRCLGGGRIEGRMRRESILGQAGGTEAKG